MQAIEKIRVELDARKLELEKRIRAIDRDVSHQNNPLSSDWSEQAVERENDEVLEALGIAAQKELHDINLALQKIANNTYANCSICAQPIPFARLNILPQTNHCTRCAEELEANGRE